MRTDEEASRPTLPTGTVTFLFTDIQGSTTLLQRLGDDYPPLLSQHHRILLDSLGPHKGVRVKTEGDAIFAVFSSAVQAVRAAVDAQRALWAHPWPEGAEIRVRMGLHTGEGRLSDDDYVGIDVHRAARIASVGHGGQVVLSDATRALAGTALPEGIELLDLGEHRLKDLVNVEHLYQVRIPGLPDIFPPLRTLDAHPNNLLAQLTTFVGREREIEQITELLRHSRLVTLTGPGGTGKTRTSLQVAASSLEAFPDGVYFVPLAPVTDPAVVAPAIAQELGLKPLDDRTIVEALHEHLRSRDLLLILDNLEQIPDVTPVVGDLLAAAPGLRILATTREILRLSGEQEFPIPPLSFPTDGETAAESVAGHGAVRLFVERAREARPDFELTDDNARAVAAICARLEGLPLAIELAAARLRLFSPEELRDRLQSQLSLLRGGARNLPERQQTMRDTIRWSYELLDSDERTAFCLASIFFPPRIDTVQGVAERVNQLRTIDALDHLTALVDKSLLRAVDDGASRRLSMLNSIREFAAERMDDDPDFRDALRRAHAEYFLDFARARHDSLYGAERETSLDELAAEVDNLRAAWRFFVSEGELERLDEMLNVLWVLHDARGWYHAAVGLTKDVLGVLSAAPSTPDRVSAEITLRTSLARALLAVRGLTQEVEDIYKGTMSLLEQAQPTQQFPVLRSIASFHLYRGEFEPARQIGDRLLELAREHGDAGFEVDALTVYGANVAFTGDTASGLTHLEQAIELFLRERPSTRAFRLGPSPGVVPFTTSAFLLWLTGYPDRAARRAAEGLDVAESLNHPFTLAYARFHVGLLHLWRQEPHLVLEHARAVIKIAEEHDYGVWRAVAMVLEGIARIALGTPEATNRIDEGINLYAGLNTPPIFWPVLLSLKAGGLGLAGRPADGLTVIEQAMELTENDPMVGAELALLKGELLMALSDVQGAASSFRAVIDVVAGAGLRMAHLRGLTRLAQIERSEAALMELKAVYDTFTEGADTAALMEARAVLHDPKISPSG